jgi:serine/threonine protein kinase
VQILTNTPDPTLPAVIATAAVTLTFNPVRRVVQRFVDQRLFGLRVGLDTLAHRAHEHNTIDTNADTQRIGSLTGTTLGTGSGALRIEGLIGKGGMGEVYRGVQPALNRPVAVKVITERLAQDSESRARFEREAQVVARLRHPNIVAVYDFASINEMAYMVMEYLDGQELDDYLKAQQHLSMDETAVIVRELAGALDYAHAQGVVHRDVKPSNVMLQRVTATGAQFPFKPVLMDFGVVKFGEVDNRLTKTGMIGTLDYVAPEQIMSAKAVDGRADQYSLAVLAFEMLTGQMPFEGSVAQIVFAHLQQPAPDIRDLLTDIPDRVALALMRAMSKQPEDRFATVSEFALAFG